MSISVNAEKPLTNLASTFNESPAKSEHGRNISPHNKGYTKQTHLKSILNKRKVESISSKIKNKTSMSTFTISFNIVL